jgi:hypothetical protein
MNMMEFLVKKNKMMITMVYIILSRKTTKFINEMLFAHPDSSNTRDV